jgi:hypothetical protein
MKSPMISPQLAACVGERIWGGSEKLARCRRKTSPTHVTQSGLPSSGHLIRSIWAQFSELFIELRETVCEQRDVDDRAKITDDQLI